MTKRLAVVFEEDIFGQKGSFQAKVERIRRLEGVSVDVYCIQVHYGPLVRLLLGRRCCNGVPERELGCPATLEFKGVKFRMLWLRYSILDHFLFFKLHLRPWFYPAFLRRKVVPLLKGYDALWAHSFEGGWAAREAFRRYGIPYLVTWHGSDIHTKPFKYPCIRPATAGILADAARNVFVSRGLLEASEAIGPGVKTVVYNGCDEEFRRYPDARREALREREGVRGKKVVAFVGNLHPVKQAQLLPEIFARMQALSPSPLVFWILGRGREEARIRRGMTVPCRFWGDVPHEKLPELMNAMDLVVLPSRNEGLGLVLLEALRCGCRAVGSRVGGIPEVLGEEHCVAPGADFPERFARRAVEALQEGQPQPLPGEMTWEAAAAREREILQACRFAQAE